MSDSEGDFVEEYSVPEIGPRELRQMLEKDTAVILLDVREPFEVTRVRLEDPRVVYAPLSRLAQFGLEGIPEPAREPSMPVVVFCHLGHRSAQVTAWLQGIGWSQVYSLAGGIDAYAAQIDPSIGRY